MIVDGGLGSELERRGFTFTSALWSSEALLTQPALIADIHRAYLAAGAQIIATATYQLSHAVLRRSGSTDAEIDALFASAVKLARDAVAAHRSATGSTAECLVAASLGPFGATVCDGSEYSGVQHLKRAALYAFHAERLQSVARSQPDVFLFETIPSCAEALVIAEVARAIGLPRVWISMSCADDSHTCSGERLRDVAVMLDAFACIEVIGINCTAPGYVASLASEVLAVTRKPIMVCPNLAGATEAEFLRYVPQWMELGVMHIGGCCGVGPELIRSITGVCARAPA